MKKKILTEQRLCELAGLQKEVEKKSHRVWNPEEEKYEYIPLEPGVDIGPAGTVALGMDPVDVVGGATTTKVPARKPPTPDEVPWGRSGPEPGTDPGEGPEATHKLPAALRPGSQIQKDLNKILTSLSKQMEREGNKEAQEMVNWLNLPERTPFGTKSEPSRVSDPRTGKESSYIHTNPYNRKSVELMSYKPHPIRIGSPLDGGFPEHWSARQRQAAGNIWQFMHKPQGFKAAQEVAQLVHRVTQSTKGEKFPSKIPALDVSSGSPEAQKLIALLDADL